MKTGGFIRSRKQPHSSQAGWARMDLLALLLASALLGSIVLPVLARTTASGDQLFCMNNLRQTAQAARMWAGDHNEYYPWMFYDAGDTKPTHTWGYFEIMRDELRTPRILACPADSRKPAEHFSSEPGGLASPEGGQDNAVSYFLGLDLVPNAQRQILAGDRHFNGGVPNMGCRWLPSFTAYGMRRRDAEDGNLTWTNAIHGPNTGNLALVDGRVTAASPELFRKLIIDSEGDSNFQNHTLPPY
jgi:hypothetical protein